MFLFTNAWFLVFHHHRWMCAYPIHPHLECVNRIQSLVRLEMHNFPIWFDELCHFLLSKIQFHTLRLPRLRNHKPFDQKNSGNFMQQTDKIYKIKTSLFSEFATARSFSDPSNARIKWSQWMVDGTAVFGNPEDFVKVVSNLEIDISKKNAIKISWFFQKLPFSINRHF